MTIDGKKVLVSIFITAHYPYYHDKKSSLLKSENGLIHEMSE